MPARIKMTFAILSCMTMVAGRPVLDAAGQAAKTEVYAVPTTRLSDAEFLRGEKGHVNDVITGELRLPSLGTARVPALLILHGSGGILGNEDYWAKVANEMGVAAFLLDMFTGRGIVNVGSDQEQLGFLTMINDAYRALDLLVQHPRIDPSRIAVLGGSRGGRATLYASMKRFQRMHGTPGREFAAYLPFYAPCYTQYLDDEDVSDRPIRLFHGAADNGVPVAACRSYVERLRKRGTDVQLFEFAGAYHLFDNPLMTMREVPRAQTMRNCTLAEKNTGEIVNAKTGMPFTVSDPCVERGYTQGYDVAAAASATKTVRDTLTQVFRLRTER